MMVVPKTLLVADYILSPQIAVERKSLSDLYQSFSSGRLYNQAEQMTRLFTKPILLIEFDQSQPFALPHDPPKSYATIPTTSKGDFGKGGKKGKKKGSTEGGGGSGGPTDDINVSQIRSKLVILTLHFPRLRIIWSRSPYETAQLFQELKVGQEEPESTSGGNDVDDDVSISFHAAGGGGSSSSSALHDRDPDESNPELFECVDILHKLPGISDRNAFLVLRGSTASPSSAPSSSSSVTGAGLMAPHNLAELAQLSAQQLGELLHSPAEGAQLSKFFTHNFHQHRYQPGAQYHQDDDDGNDGGEGQLVDNPN
jgi:DNA excision repair protein ERCC-4